MATTSGTTNVRIEKKYLPPLKRLVKESKSELGLKKYRSMSHAVSRAVETFLIQENRRNTANANNRIREASIQ